MVKVWSLSLLMLPIGLASAFGGLIDKSSNYLYEGKPDASAVTEYKDGVDFTKSKAPRIVEFYSPYCG